MSNDSDGGDRAALIDRILQKKGLLLRESSTVQRRQESGPCALSFAQRRLWFFEQMEPGSPVYHIPFGERFRGRLDLAVLEWSFNEIVRRHEILRTTFATVDDEPVQIVAPSLALAVAVFDLTGLSERERETEVERLMVETASRPFDLARGPLLRVAVLRLAPDDQILLVTIHHIVSDGWSLGLLCGELAQLYQARSDGKPSPLPEPARQYTDFSAWQRKWLTGEILDQQVSYWKRQLGEPQAALDLPTDYPAGATPTYRGATHALTIPAPLTASLNQLSQREGATLFMTFLAAFQLLLFRHTRQESITVGAPIVNRNRRELEHVMGLFLNTLVLRTDLSANPTFQELLGRVRTTTLGAFEHQDLPFEKLVEVLRPDRNLRDNPFFDVMINYQVIVQSFEIPGLTRVPLERPIDSSKSSMTLYVLVDREEVRLVWMYRRDLFAPEHISNLIDQYVHLLGQIAADPTQPIGRYSLVTPSAMSLIPDPRATLAEPRYPLVSQLLASRGDRAPSDIALRLGERELTYRDFCDGADRLARGLVARGIVRGDVVAIVGPRSFGVITAMAAVLASGGVLVTIDPRFPAERQRVMLREAAARLLLCVGGRRPGDEWLESLPSLALMTVDGDGVDGTADHARLASLVLPEVEPEDPAYVFFTSGTTGTPKAVRGLHKGLSHFVTWQQKTFSIGPGDRSAQLTGFSFDVLLRDVFTPLTSGATLCLSEDDPGPDTISWIEREKITLLHSVPSLLQSWLISLPAKISLRALRWVFSAGEPLTEALVVRWRETFPESGRIANFYGPTETSLAKFCYQLPAALLPGVQPVGWPLPETQALVLSPEGQLCGIGEPGEVAIRTPFRTAGYSNSPEATKKQFVRNPFRTDERDLIYHTGDRGRYRSDGALELFGRTDDQVKVQGIRVEPAEIQMVLSRHAGVQTAAVVAREDVPGDRRLVAYFVPRAGSSPTVRELREFVGSALPEYMVPSAFVELQAIPLTLNGKLDRKALPAPNPSQERRDVAGDPATARSLGEEVLAGIWSQTLGVDRIGLDDNFFDLGGHSLLAIQLVARIREVFRVALPLRSLFEAPTVAGVAKRIEAMARAGHTPLPPIEHHPSDGDLPLSFAQQELWRRTQEMPSSPVFQRSHTWRLTGPLDIAVLERSIGEIVARHETLRTTFTLVKGAPVARVAPPSTFQLALVNLRAATDGEGEMRRLAAEDSQRPFDLGHGPLTRLTLFRISDENHVLLLTRHNIVSDGGSRARFRYELGELYRAFAAGLPSPLPEPTLHYSDYARWEQSRLRGEILEQHLSFWKRRLDGYPPLFRGPERSRAATCEGADTEFSLSTPLYEALRALSQQEGATLFMTLVAALGVLLSFRTGLTDITLGTWATGRTRATECVMGLFVTLSVLRTDLSGDPTFRQLLARVREVALEAHEYQDVAPWDVLPPHGLDVIVNFVHAGSPLVLPGLAIIDEPVAAAAGAVRFDLQVQVVKGEAGLGGSIRYNADLFDRKAIELMVQQFESLLERIVDGSDQPLSVLRGSIPLADRR